MILKRRTKQRTFRRVSALLMVTLCGFFVFPVPVANLKFGSRTSGKDDSVPFPCMSRPCGCRTAEDCWNQCCCMTNSQKLAWAVENDVEVPEHVLAAADQERRQQQAPGVGLREDLSTGQTSACATELNGLFSAFLAFFGHAETEDASACCSKSAGSRRAASDCCDRGSVAVKLVSTVQALQCRGVSLVMAVMSTMMLPQATQMESVDQLPDYLLAVQSERLPDAVLQPPVPPPRISGV